MALIIGRAVKNPFQIVNVLAEILNGKGFQFFPLPGSYLLGILILRILRDSSKATTLRP